MSAVRPRVLAALATVVATTVLAGCGGGSAGGSPPVGGGLLKAPQQAPAISGATLDGRQLALSAYRGKVVVLNFYASWCAPCRAETPLLVRTAKATAADGVQFVGVDSRDSTTNGTSFVTDAGVTYPSLVDSSGTLLTKFKNVNAASIPQTFVFARDGKLVARYTGAISDEAAFTKVLETLTAQQVSR